MPAPSANASILCAITPMPISDAATVSSRIASNARPMRERRSRHSSSSTTITDTSTCHHCVSCGMPFSPSAPPVSDSAFRISTRTTSPKPSVAIARYTPDRRSVGPPISSATSVGAAMPPASATANGAPAFIVSSDAV